MIQSYDTSCLVLEIAGMADLSVSMAKSQGKTYLEYVDIVMNQLKREGGDLIKMDEGTFVCVWPKGGKSSAERARHAAQCAVSMYRDFFSKQQKENNPSLKIRAGIGFGNMSFLHIGGTNEEIEYVAIGEGLEDALCALKTCQPGEIMVASNAVSVLGNAFNTTKTRRKGNPSVMDFHVACNMRLDPFVFNAMKALGDMDEDDADEFDMKLMKYVPGEIMRHITGDHDHQELWSNDVRPITVVRLSGKMDTFGKKTEEIASLWNRFKIYIISISLLLLISVSVYQYLEISEYNEKVSTIEKYYKASNNDSIEEILGKLEIIQTSNEFSQNLIDLKIADIHIVKGDVERGLENLEQIFKSKNQSILGDLALYKYLMLKIDQVTLNEFNNLIENFNSKENNFNYLFSELVGIKNIIDGQYSEGKIIFESLLNDASVPNEIKIRAEKYINIIN